MSYTPKTWTCGDVITADDLNHIENGIANSGGGTEPLVVTSTSRMATSEECSQGGTVITYSHSWQEIYDALEQGKAVFLKSSYDDEEERGASMYPIISASMIDSTYSCVYLLVSDATETVMREAILFADATSKTVVRCLGND